jgi:hypothetical protein
MNVTENEEFIDEIKREVKLQCSKPKNRKEGQYSIQIPKEIVRELELKKGDIVIINIPLKDKSKYSIKFKKIIE